MFVDEETRQLIFEFLADLDSDQSRKFMNIFFRLLTNYENKSCPLLVKESPAVPYPIISNDNSN